MKQLLNLSLQYVSSLSLLVSFAQAQVLPQYLNFSTEITKAVEIDYLLYVPDDYHPSEEKPLLLFLTGEDCLGDINQLREVGPPREVEAGMSFDYFIAVPQLPGDVLWDTEALVELLEQIGNSYNIDNSQIWLTGLGDRGGWGAWELALLYPDIFEKFAPVASSPGTQVWSAHELSTWIFHGALDEIVPIEDARVMFYELNWDDVDVQLTEFDSLGHDIGDTVYSDPGFYEWISGQVPTYGSGAPTRYTRSLNSSIQKPIDDDYLLYLPVGYDSGTGDWPLVVYLHGSGSAIYDLDAIRDGGPPQLFEEGMNSDFILLCPQLHDDVHWDIDRIHALTQEVVETNRIDEGRLYLTGLSRGGFGAWEYGVTHPDLFAAIIPISARDVAGVELLVNTNVWIFHGDQDTGVPWQGSQTAYNRLNAIGADVHFTLYEGVGHWAWEPAYETEGLWTWVLNQENELVSVSPSENSIPETYVLLQNYPNPFNPSTTISYGVPESANVKIIVYDIHGNQVRTISSEAKVDGWYNHTWNGRDDTGKPIPSGVYMTHLQSGQHTRVIKMLHLK